MRAVPYEDMLSDSKKFKEECLCQWKSMEAGAITKQIMHSK